MKLCLLCNFQTASDEHGICPHDGSSMIKVSDDPLLGMVIEDRYRIESIIGQGSAGVVYRARQEPIGRNIAIKVLHEYLVSDDELTKRFHQEAKAASRLSHPNIITIYDFGIIPLGRRPYIAMDLLDGTPLAGFISQFGPMSLDTAIPIFKMVCQALAEAHRQGVVHRDIKPENIVLVDRVSTKLFPIVVDFGIARLIQEDSEAAKITRTGTVCGSPTYMSPEQCTSSKVDRRSDIYSLAVVFYEVLTGRVPFYSDEIVKVMTMHLMDEPPTLKATRPDMQFPERLENVLNKALSKQPEQRFQNMDEFAAALEQSVSPSSNHVSIPSATEIIAKSTPSQEPKLPQNSKSNAISIPSRNARQRNRPSTTQLRQVTVKGMGIGALFARQIAPVILTIGTFTAAIIFAMNEAKLFKIAPERHRTEYAENLIKQGRYEEALPILQDLKKKGELEKTKAETLNKARFSVAEIYAHKKHYSDATALLRQIPQKSKYAGKAKTLIRKYKSGKTG